MYVTTNGEKMRTGQVNNREKFNSVLQLTEYNASSNHASNTPDCQARHEPLRESVDSVHDACFGEQLRLREQRLGRQSRQGTDPRGKET
jgi:hypothetical protein